MAETVPAGRRRVLLVGWDAADWKIIQPLLDRGEMPVLESIVNAGVMGNLASIRPMLSPMLWNSIATGKRPYLHGVHGFTEVDASLGRPVPVSSQTRRCRAVWDILNARGLRTHVVGWFATHPAPALEGACVSERFGTRAPDPGKPWPMDAGTVWPERLAGPLADLRVRPEDIDGQVLRLLVPDAARVNQQYDKRLHELALRLAECFSIHAAATYLLAHEPWDFAAVYHRSIDWLCHEFIRFHPPRLESVNDTDFTLYHQVVSGAYRLHDALLGRLLALAGAETTVLVVSDHGFQSNHLRLAATPNVPAGIAEWHRPQGMFAAAGPGLRRDELLHGASLLDITPTILALFGLPVGRDMEGRVLAEAFLVPPQVETLDSWEDPGASGLARNAGPSGSGEVEEWSVLRQFIELGYVDDPMGDPDEAVRSTERENRWNLARSYLDARRFLDALPLLEAVYAEWPERRDYCATLAFCQFHLGLYEEASETAETLTSFTPTPADRLLAANIELRRRRYHAALEHLSAAEAAGSRLAGLENLIGTTRLRLGHWPEAEAAYRRALAFDQDDPLAHVGLTYCHLHADRFDAAAESALQALGLRFDLPIGHHLLGIALARLGDRPRAIEAFETCLRYGPAWTPAHRYLAALYHHQPDGEAKVAEHRAQLNARAARRVAGVAQLGELRRQIDQRTRDRVAERQRRRALTGPAPEPLPGTGHTTAPSEPMDFLIVSGLPRSGTSLMMQMLAAGGLELMSDDLRPADVDNPHGYFEWQEIKGLPKNPRLIEKTQGRVTKVISMLLPWLPQAHRFRVIFMLRPVADVIASQERMRELGPAATSAAPREKMETELRQHRDRMLGMLRASPNVQVLEVDYPALLDNPLTWSRQVAEFAGLTPDCAAAMAGVVSPDIRQRSNKTG